MPTSSFAALQKNQFSRKWGGNESSVDPYISGYFFTKFLLPDTNMHIPGLSSTTEAQTLLSACCLSVTLPGGTLNRADFTGLGGIKWGAPTNVDYDNTITCRFLEFSGIPVLSIFHNWVKMIRDYRCGVTRTLTSNTYTKQKYSGILYYWSTQPDGQTVEYASCATGLFPLKDPQEQYGGDITAYDKLELDIDFNVDYLWHEDWVLAKCRAYTYDAQQESVINEYKDR